METLLTIDISIVAKLVELGYQKDVTYAEENIWDKDSLEIHRFVRQSKPLTQRSISLTLLSVPNLANAFFSPAWNNNCADLLEFIEQNITPQRLYDEYEDNITVRLSALRLAAHTRMAPKHRPFFPRLRDLVSFPEVKAMMNPFDTPEFDPQDVDKLVPIVDDLVVSWKADCQRQLEESIRSSAPDIPEDIAIWDLAIANMVSCTDAICQDVLVEPWPNGVLHDCKYYGYPIKSNDEERFIDNDNPHTLARNKWYDNVMNTSLGYKWSMKYLHPLVHGVENIVKLCGKDPLQVTAAEMDQFDARFFCFDQEKEKGVREILTWREAVSFAIIECISSVALSLPGLCYRQHKSHIGCDVMAKLLIGKSFPRKTERRLYISNWLLSSVKRGPKLHNVIGAAHDATLCIDHEKL